MSAERRPVRDFWLHVHGPRAADFQRVYGTTIIAVKSPAPHLAELPGFDELQPVYLLDLEWVKEQGRYHDLVAFIAERFGMDENAVEAGLQEEGMPILEADTTLRIDHPQRWLD